MHRTNARKASALLGLVLALAIPGSTLAATASSTSTESLGVAVSISITGVPPTLSYGAANNAGDLATAPSFHVTGSSNNGMGWEIRLNASALTSSGGTIPKSARSIAGADAGTVNYADDIALTGTDGPGDKSADLTMRVQIPASAAAGNYTGSATFTIASK